MKNKLYNLIYILLLVIYIFTIIFLPNENYLNLIFTVILIITFVLLLVFKKVEIKIFLAINILFLVYVGIYNYINIPTELKNYQNNNFNYISQNIEESDDENIKKIKEILNNKLDLNSFYDILGIISKNENIDYSSIEFEKNIIFEKLINDVLFDENNGDLIYGKTLFYSKYGFENYKKYFKNYLILKYLEGENINGKLFENKNNLYYLFLSKRYFYNSKINEKVFKINYDNLLKIEESIR